MGHWLCAGTVLTEEVERGAISGQKCGRSGQSFSLKNI
jgi:hypothetical protein